MSNVCFDNWLNRLNVLCIQRKGIDLHDMNLSIETLQKLYQEGCTAQQACDMVVGGKKRRQQNDM